MLKNLYFMVCVTALVCGPATASEIADWQQRRVAAWQTLITQHREESEPVKVRRVNEFINQMRYAEDNHKWGQPDYWATPLEFIAKNGGDCEDYAIAKYFTLRQMGVPEKRLRITYARVLPSLESHMLLYYYPENGSEAVVMDNRTAEIKAASERRDLLPVYSFNQEAYWLNRADGSLQYIGPARKLGRWQGLLARRKDSIHNIVVTKSLQQMVSAK